MFTWWKRHNFDSQLASAKHLYRPYLEQLEIRETPATALFLGPTVNVSQAFHNQREQSIAVNPLNTNQVAVFSNIDDITGDGANDEGIFSAWSVDGGLTWNTQYLFTDATLLSAACCDPQAAWDKFGNLFMTYLTADGDVAVALSTNGGQSFSVQLLTSDGDHDQPSISVGPGPYGNLGSVWVSYFTGPPANLIPRLDTQVAVVTQFGIMGSFNNPVPVPGSDTAFANFGDIAIGPNGQAVITYQSIGGPGAGPAQIWINVDPDGMGPAGWGIRQLVTSTNVGPARIIPGTSNNFGIDAEAGVAFDTSKGPHRGRLYLTYTDANSTAGFDTDVVVRFSDNNGLTWSGPVRVNDVTTGSQFNQSIAVDPTTGFVGLGWYDTRADGTGVRAEFFATVSDDGGLSYAKNIKASLGPSQSILAEPPAVGNRPLGFGDFNKIAFTNGVLQLVWADNSPQLPGNPSPGRMDIAAARIRVASPTALRVFFPVRWKLVNAQAGIFAGKLTILSKFPIRGPFMLTLTLPHPSLSFLLPANTQVGNTVTFTINAGLKKNRPLRVMALLSNPLKLPLPRFLIGFAASLS